MEHRRNKDSYLIIWYLLIIQAYLSNYVDTPRGFTIQCRDTALMYFCEEVC